MDSDGALRPLPTPCPAPPQSAKFLARIHGYVHNGPIMQHSKHTYRAVPLQMRLSMRAHCPYFSGRTEQRIAVDMSQQPGLHDQLAQAGFRRVENWAYKPVCPDCQACVPWRVDAQAFKHTQSTRRIMRRNADLVRLVNVMVPTFEHFELFKRYVTHRHHDGEMAMMSRDEFIHMITNSPIDTKCVTYRDAQRRLLGFVIMDVQNDGLSAVYSFFDPEQKSRSLGTFIIMDLMNIVKEMGLRWLYLGYQVDGSRKMNYKKRFRPAEMHVDGRWQPYEPPEETSASADTTAPSDTKAPADTNTPAASS